MAIPKVYTSQSISSEVNRLIRLHPREKLGTAILAYIDENFIPKLELKIEDKTLDQFEVMAIVESYFGVAKDQMLIRCRRRAILYPRQMAQFFLYRHSPLHATGVGNEFNMDHTSVLSSINRIVGLCQSDSKVQEDFEKITKLLLDKKRELYGKVMEEDTSPVQEAVSIGERNGQDRRADQA